VPSSLAFGPESIEEFIEDSAFSPLNDLAPPPSPSPGSKLDRRKRRRLRQRDNLLTERGEGDGGVRQRESLFSINHSILSAR